MDPEGFASGLFRWNPTRAIVQAPTPVPQPQQQSPATPQTVAFGMRLGGFVRSLRNTFLHGGEDSRARFYGEHLGGYEGRGA